MSGFLHLRAADDWPDFDLGPDVVVDDGSLRLTSTAGVFPRAGAFLSGRVEVNADATPWFRLRVLASELQEDEHVELFTVTSDASTKPPVALGKDVPFTSPPWHGAPRDLGDVLIPGEPRRYLWVGGVLRGAGTSSPRVHQIRVDYGRDTSIASLPAVYGRPAGARDTLERVLALHEGPLQQLDVEIADLPRLFDAAAAPAGEDPSWLSWLAAGLDFDLVARWTEQQARQRLASAFELYGTRGTIEGLRRYLEMYAGVAARITEPAPASVWSLGQTSTLGFTTRLAAAAAQGAVLDSSATLDASHLTRGDDFGAGLFADTAHRFCVEVYCADLRRPGALDDVRATLDREKPAHTAYALRVIAPRMRIGVQARLGIDSIVGQRGAYAAIGSPLGTGTLGGTSAPCPAPKEC